jgi:rhodanese-related sulfurtransferase
VTTTTQTIDIHTFVARHSDGAYVIDVREPMEYLGGHVPGAELVPMSRITGYVDRLPKDREVYVICQSGNRSLSMASLLERFGVNAISVDGGTSAWSALGKPLVAGARAA